MPSSCPPHNHPHQGTPGRARCMPDLRRGQRIARQRACAAPRGAAASASLGRGWLRAEHNVSTMTPTTDTNTPGPCCTQLDPEEPSMPGHGRYWTLRSCFASRGSAGGPTVDAYPCNGTSSASSSPPARPLAGARNWVGRRSESAGASSPLLTQSRRLRPPAAPAD
jgi:hypothetical protein